MTDLPTITSPDFSAILAASIHDMKNSLGVICGLIQNLKQANEVPKPELAQLEFEARRMNNHLMQLLSLYKIEISKFSLNIDEYLIKDILDDIYSQQTSLLELNNITLELEYPENSYCYCDLYLLENAIGTLLNNAQRYSQKKIILSARAEDGYTKFTIEDDGNGFPDINLSTDYVNFNTGSTGLGLYFTHTIAHLHESNIHHGYSEISNESRLGGGKVSIFIP